MNLPLNIDFQQILLHMLNLVLLVGGLYFLLYKPVKAFMDKRAKLYESMDSEAKAKLENAEKMQADYESRMHEIESEIERKKNDACSEAAKTGALEIEKAKKQADKIIADARKSAEHERDKILSDAQSEVASIAAAATEKLLYEKTGDSCFEQFLNSVERKDSNKNE